MPYIKPAPHGSCIKAGKNATILIQAARMTLGINPGSEICLSDLWDKMNERGFGLSSEEGMLPITQHGMMCHHNLVKV